MDTSKYYQKYFPVFVLVVLVSYLALRSDLMPFSRDGYISTDTGVWLQIVKEMSEGRMVYRDLFDHKGPLLFLLYSVFFRMGEITGVWGGQCIFLAITIIVSYRCTMKITSNRVIGAYAVMSALLGRNIFVGEDFPIEEVALPFIMMSLFVFLSYFTDNERKIRKKEILLLGFCMGSVVCLRPNMIALWVVFVLAVFIEGIYSKRYREMFSCVCYFLAGLLLIVGFLCMWLWYKGALESCWEESVWFNFLYVGKSDFSSRIQVLGKYFFHPLQFSCICFNVYLLIVKKESRILYGSNLLYVILNLVMVSMSGVDYPHYKIVLIPGFILPFAGGIDCVWSWLGCLKLRWRLLEPFWIVSLVLFLLFGKGGGFWGLKKIVNNFSVSEAEKENLEVMQFIEQNTSEDEKITVLGNCAYIYLGSNRCSATEFIYTDPVCEMSGELRERFLEQIETGKPLLIVVKEGWFDEPSRLRKEMEVLLQKEYFNTLEAGDVIVYKQLL